MKRMRNLKGFTLIELIVVILIIGILATIAVIGYSSITAEAQNTALTANAKQIATDLSVEATLAETTVDAWILEATTDSAFSTEDEYLTNRYPGIDVDYTAEVTTPGSEAPATVTVTNASGDVVIDVSGNIAQLP